MAKNDLDELMSVGIDIGKDVFHRVGFDPAGNLVLRKKIKRLALTTTFEDLPRCVVGIWACMSAHFASRTPCKLGFEPRIIPAIYVKPFNQGQMNDDNNAEAIAEAALRPDLTTVSEKTPEQLDLQALHRVRSRLVSRRTATMNQIRVFLLAHGITVRKNVAALRNSLDAILNNRSDELSLRMRKLILGLQQNWLWLDKRIHMTTSEIKAFSASEESCRRPMIIPGIGPLISTAVVAAIGTGEAYKWGA